MSKAPAIKPGPAPARVDPEASVADAAAACGGDVKAAVWELLLRNAWLESEVERLAGAVSQGYVRRNLRPN